MADGRIKPEWLSTPWGGRLAAAAGTGVALSLPLIWPGLFAHSIYLIGIGAVLAAAWLAGPVSALAAALATIALAIHLDRQSNFLTREIVVRAILFAVMAGVIARAAQLFHQFRNRSAATVVELANKRAVMQAILDTGPDAMLTIDSHGIISRFSKAAEMLFGWKPDEVIGRNVSMLMPAPYHGEHDGYIRRYLDTGERQIIGKSREVTGLRKDGTHFPMVLHVGEVNAGGERQFTGFVHDLTALKDANDRTQDLRVQLAHIWSMNSLGEMAAVLAHELNQPLAAITNYVRGARNLAMRLERPDDDLIEAVDRAGDQAIRAGEIIRRMRGLVARKDMDHAPESLAAMISEINFMIALVARDGDVLVTYDLADGPDEVLADRIQIQQVVSNLVRNAVEAMGDRPRRLVEVISEPTDKGWTVRVEDSGPGVPPDMVASLFEPLNSSKPHGMGLGLSICRAIIENHGGELWVDKSRLGGAAFCFSLRTPGTT